LTSLVTKVRDGHATEYSEADRKTNWLQGHALQCMLKSYTSGGTIDDTVRNLCESEGDYEKAVGVMDYQSEKIMACVRPSPPMFSCQETTVLFAGSVWTTGNESSKYADDDKFLANVTLASGAGAFSWCQAKHERGNCRGFVCADPWKPKANMAGIHCTLTECSEYECCGGSGSAALPAAAAPEAAAAAVAESAAAADEASAAVAGAPAAGTTVKDVKFPNVAAAPAPSVLPPGEESPVAAPAATEEGLLATKKAKAVRRPVAKPAAKKLAPVAKGKNAIKLSATQTE